MLSLPLFAVHISDGVLGWPALAAGFAVAALLAAFAAWRVREDEIPRIALMTAAFFVASSIHVRLGPTSVHLLLNGLVGVVLGRRAPLAVLVGVTLQALLIPHGGVSTIGVNACTETIPALLAAALFGLVSRVSERRRWFRSLLAAAAALVWGWCLLFGAVVLWTAPLAEAIRFTDSGALVLRFDELRPALLAATHPLALLALALFTAAAVVLERRLNRSAVFPRGALVGVLAVVGTTLLTGAVLLLGAADRPERFETFVTAVFLAHLPLALLEGLIVGGIVAFLWRVKPRMLGAAPQLVATAAALLTLLTLTPPALAHALEVERTIDRQKREVTLTCAFEGGAAPKDATVTVRRADGSVLAEGPLDEKGRYTFRYERPESLSAHVRAEGGHKSVLRIQPSEMGDAAEKPPTEAKQGGRLHDLLLGVALLLAAAAFVLAWRTSVRLERLAGQSGRPGASA